ncbi:hypothetical protein ACFWZW_14020 [Microbacterium enclense]|uniref:hypothetical protein n=1 Tax=Microbacterium enclense TaxID=993073 RepID=UPI0036DAF332
MSRIIVEQLITADGFVQDSDSGMKFMDVEPIDDTDSEQLRMLSRIGGIVLGRRTYEMFSSYWPTIDPADARRHRPHGDQAGREPRRPRLGDDRIPGHEPR